MTIITSPFRHFSFDLWLTLIKSNPDFKTKRNELFQSFFGIEEPIAKVALVVRYYDQLANRISEITGTHFDGNQIYCLVLKNLNVAIDTITVQQLDTFQAAVEELFMQYKPVLIDNGIENRFKAIKNQGKTISILSNTAFIKGRTLRKILDHYELSEYFSFQIYSDEVGLSKPNPDIFDLVFQKTKEISSLTRQDVVHIGDNRKADYQGAINYGFNGILI